VVLIKLSAFVGSNCNKQKPVKVVCVEKFFVFSEINMKHTNTRCWQNVRCFIVKPGGVHSCKLQHTCVQYRLLNWKTWKPHN